MVGANTGAEERLREGLWDAGAVSDQASVVGRASWQSEQLSWSNGHEKANGIASWE